MTESGEVQGHPPRRVRAAHVDGAYRVLATVRIAKGQAAVLIDGSRVERPSRHSMQLDDDLHIEVVGPLSVELLLERHPWRFTNHGCEPNTRLVGSELLALRDIGPGEEITFNYNTTEWDLAEPFRCACGSPRCAGTIRGFRHLTQEEREQLRPLLATHLKRRHDRQTLQRT